MPLRVYFPLPPSTPVLPSLFKNLDAEVELSIGPIPPNSYDVLVAGRPTMDQLTHSSDLHTLVIPYAGLPEATAMLLRQFPQLGVCNLHHNAVGTAEMGMALLLAAAKRIVLFDRELRDGDWSRRYGDGSNFLLEGKQGLILGYGAIGRRIAAMCSAFGMRVAALWRKAERRRIDDVSVHPIADLHTCLQSTDVLFICAPLTNVTRGMIGAMELSFLPPHSILVNVARGPVVDERALYQALKGRKIGAAGLDVWYRYPQSEGEREQTRPSEFPIHLLDNVVMSPHVGGDWDGVEKVRMHYLAGLLNALASGEEIESRVDREAGY